MSSQAVHPPLLANPEIAREPSAQRAVVEVAVGVLLRQDQGFLMTSRPAGRPYAGYWEFPGGKVEPGESVAQALARELHEELGITVSAATPWKVEMVDYPHALVRLHFYKVTGWTGELQMKEMQSAQWQCLPVTVSPVLPGTLPVLDWLKAEQSSPNQ
jgi:8-oxo-dGTP diphosphatase